MSYTLSELVSAYSQKIENLTLSLVSISANIIDLQAQQSTANSTLTDLTASSDAWGTWKALQFGVPSAVEFCTSGSYGVSNLTEWGIVSGGGCGSQKPVIYKPSDVSTSEHPNQYYRQEDFAEIYDHINDSIDVNGTYGLAATIVNLQTAESVAEANRDKYTALVSSYGRYA